MRRFESRHGSENASRYWSVRLTTIAQDNDRCPFSGELRCEARIAPGKESVVRSMEYCGRVEIDILHAVRIEILSNGLVLRQPRTITRKDTGLQFELNQR